MLEDGRVTVIRPVGFEKKRKGRDPRKIRRLKQETMKEENLDYTHLLHFG
jgi:hypothetical protein